jgi:hypothetical protein
MPKWHISLGTVLGFSDELQKIAMSFKPTSFGDVRKEVSYAGTALARRKPSYAKVNKQQTLPASSSELTESAKTVQPPPATMPGGDL